MNSYPRKSIPFRISEGTKVLQFVIESFMAPDAYNRQFRYMLSGFDEEFGEWTESYIKEYSNLKAGSYSFQVQTFGPRGEIVSSSPFMVIVNPPYYKSWLAKIIYVLLGLTALFLLTRVQKQYYKGKEVKIEQEKKMELEKQQKELQLVKEEQIRSELRHLNNLLASSTMNLVVKN